MENQPNSSTENAPRVKLEQILDETARREHERLEVQKQRINYLTKLAEMFVRSGMYSDLKKQTPEEGIACAVVKIMLGETMGMTPVESLQALYFVNGRPSVDAAFRAARMQQNGYDWKVLRLDTKGCSIQLFKDGKPITRTAVRQTVSRDGKPMTDASGKPLVEEYQEPVVESFTEADAQAAGLATKDMYRKYPRNMYFARCITNTQRFWAPGVLGPAGATLGAVEEADTEGYDLVPSFTAGSHEAAAAVADQKLAAMAADASEEEMARETQRTLAEEAVVEQKGGGQKSGFSFRGK